MKKANIKLNGFKEKLLEAAPYKMGALVIFANNGFIESLDDESIAEIFIGQIIRINVELCENENPTFNYLIQKMFTKKGFIGFHDEGDDCFCTENDGPILGLLSDFDDLFKGEFE